MTSPVTPVESVEHVLVDADASVPPGGSIPGLHGGRERGTSTCCSIPPTRATGPRAEVEVDPSFKQLIPYCIFRCEGKIFHYRRGSAAGGRAAPQQAVGGDRRAHLVGRPACRRTSVYREAMRREIAEEVFLESGFREELRGAHQ